MPKTSSILRAPLLATLLVTGAMAQSPVPQQAPTTAADFVQPLSAQSPDQPPIEGRMNWSQRVFTAWGEGLPPDEVTSPARRRLLGLRAAKVTALRNLLELVGQVQVDSRTTVSMVMLASDTVQTRVSGILQGARVVAGSQQERDGVYRLAMEIDLGQPFADAVLPDSAAWARQALPPPGYLPPADLPDSDSLVVFVPPRPYTGLIVDARGLDLRPSMAPRVFDAEGRLIYGAGTVDRQYATAVGVVGYDRDIDRAAQSERLGGPEAHPLVVVAQEVVGPHNADVVIDTDAGVRARMADAETGFLSECRVTFIIGPLPPQLDSAFSDSVDLELMRRAEAAGRLEAGRYRPAADTLSSPSASPESTDDD